MANALCDELTWMTEDLDLELFLTRVQRRIQMKCGVNGQTSEMRIYPLEKRFLVLRYFSRMRLEKRMQNYQIAKRGVAKA
jgi:hypothetical protein